MKYVAIAKNVIFNKRLGTLDFKLKGFFLKPKLFCNILQMYSMRGKNLLRRSLVNIFILTLCF